MIITIANIQSELLVHTVSIRQHPPGTHTVYLFRCYNCGTPIAQVQGEFMRIAPGLEPSDHTPVIHQCFRCRMYYTFQTKNYLRGNRCAVVLHNRPGVYAPFKCVVCRTELIRMEGMTIMDQVKPVVLPYLIDCPKHDCHQKYTIQDLI